MKNKQSIKNLVYWCEGKLEELRRAGFISGEGHLHFKNNSLSTRRGMNVYLKLKSRGIKPSREDIIKILECLNESHRESQLKEYPIEETVELMINH